MNTLLIASLMVAAAMVSGRAPEFYPSCESHGNVYTPYPGTDCYSFDQRRGEAPVPTKLLERTLDCAPGTRFSIEKCVCDHADKVVCQAISSPPSCESNGMYTAHFSFTGVVS